MIKNKGLLIIGGVINFMIAVTHWIIPIIGPPAYIFFGAGEAMAEMASENPIMPGAITYLLGICFFVFGLYALSGAGVIRSLPMLTPVLAIVGFIYIVRGLAVPLDVYFYLTEKTSLYFVLFSFIALSVGFLYLWPLPHSWQDLKKQVFGHFRK
jgi:putative oxidoreductase